MSTTDDDSVVCTVNKSEPPFQPNVYTCESQSYCCTYLGRALCCDSQISLYEVFLQSWPIGLMFLCFLLFAGLVNWYFSDDDSSYRDFEKEGTDKRNVIEMLCPSERNDIVDDPLFGPLHVENVPRKAYVKPTEETAVDKSTRSPRPVLDES